MGFLRRLFGKRSESDQKEKKPVAKLDLTSSGNVLAVAIVYEGHLPAGHQLDTLALARELTEGAVSAGVLQDAEISDLAVVKAQRVDEATSHGGDYEPGSELPKMLKECVPQIRQKLVRAGHDLGQVGVRQVTLRGRSSIASNCYFGLMILNPPREKPQFRLRKAAANEIQDLERANEVKRSTIEEMDMEVYRLSPPEGEPFTSKDLIALSGVLTCPICRQEVPIHIEQINFSGFLRADSKYLAACPRCKASTEFRGITTGEDSAEESKSWLIVFPATGPAGAGARPGSGAAEPRIKVESIERAKTVD